MHIIALAEKNAGQYRPLLEIATSFVSGRGSPVSLGGDCFGNADLCFGEKEIARLVDPDGVHTVVGERESRGMNRRRRKQVAD